MRARLNEEWRDIPGWDFYQVSDYGRVRRLECLGADGRYLKERMLKIQVSDTNTNSVRCWVNLGSLNYHRGYSVGQLMLMAFVRLPEPNEQCRHLDDNSLNNALSNLQWGTAAENRNDAKLNGKLASGKRNGNYKHGRYCL